MINDDDEFGGPDLDEMQTTTQRNRGRGGRSRVARNAPPGPVAPQPKRARSSQPKQMHEEQPDEGDNPFEGTAPLKKTRDSNSGPKDDGPKGHHGIAIIIQPMSNPIAERRQSIRNDINKAIKTEKRRGPR